ncbi:MAG: peptide deformylase [Candidatus Colwellbacteria bacterium RIFCSPLOWO2_12_FULL_44_13]|uniref:Peptide deformylase n=2 Tax=Candidatus Colwelliibacteriota TaxID=1817904 RepID=A0A1G1Z6Z8_9BACT|nr:MAG: peptide deformylase [Candidatus Colwellbacteria bacterium RIFCSPHIGHO2_12_FULL_44_17]OGY61996.1 MAG: peptide deformylase [Candidatus Colwellbacteria bacterium RIFCSPLOWO2_12_FULL_44_13]
MERIFQIHSKQDEKFLRRKVADFDFKAFTKKEINTLIKQMRVIMEAANGVGLSANQIGLTMNVFVAKDDKKFYAIFNASISKPSKTTVEFEEGCLSVPGTFASVLRPEKVILTGYDKNGKKLKIKAWGFLARVFQHEVDHLNGKLFIDHL